MIRHRSSDHVLRQLALGGIGKILRPVAGQMIEGLGVGAETVHQQHADLFSRGLAKVGDLPDHQIEKRDTAVDRQQALRSLQPMLMPNPPVELDHDGLPEQGVICGVCGRI